MGEVAFRQRARRSKRGFSSLRYFRAAVEAAWLEQLELGAGGVAPRFDHGPPVEVRLERLAAALPDSVPGAAALRAEIVALLGSLEEIESALVALDRRLLEAAERGLAGEAGSRARRRAEEAAAQFAATLPAEELGTLRESLFAQALRAETGIPVLSLFAAEALADRGDE
jgi:hypothetical protein